MYLTFNPTSGMKSLNAAQDYINDLGARASDMRPFLKSLEPDLVKEIHHEFDSSNPNKWRSISDSWREFKVSKGKPENIGVYSGDLMEAAAEGAYKVFLPTGLIWKIAPVYSIDFTRTRKIGITTSEWIRGIGRQIVNVIVGRAKSG